MRKFGSTVGCPTYVICMIVQVIDETLSPTWDELMVFDDVLVYGRREDIKVIFGYQ